MLHHVLVALLAEGHVLVEDYPGVGKTALARALSRSLDCQFARVQCTADLLPADIVGTNVYNQREGRFEFRPGPIFANVVLVDEVNRASPKTQSGLLECMQERHVTVDVHTHELARPFMVFATQNPVEYEGTYPLPEAQVDRFMVRLSMGYPSRGGRVRHARRPRGRRPRARRSSRWRTARRCSTRRTPPAACTPRKALRDYIVALLRHTRDDERVELGASPRAGLMLLRAAKAHALIEGRDHALPDDVQALAPPVLSHRLMLIPEAAGVHARGGRRRRRRRRPRPLGGDAVRSAAGCAALGIALLLVAGTFDAEPFYVTGAALALLGAGAAPWIGLGAWGASMHRTVGARSVMEDEPLAVRVEASGGPAAAAARASSTSRCSPEPAPLRAGRRSLPRCASRPPSRRRGRRRARARRARAARPARARRAHDHVGRRRTRCSCSRASTRCAPARPGARTPARTPARC